MGEGVFIGRYAGGTVFFCLKGVVYKEARNVKYDAGFCSDQRKNSRRVWMSPTVSGLRLARLFRIESDRVLFMRSLDALDAWMARYFFACFATFGYLFSIVFQWSKGFLSGARRGSIR